MRIDQIEGLAAKCTGCMACVDACPVGCISPIVGEDGFAYSAMDREKCVDCGKCFSVCPIEHKALPEHGQHLFAAYAADGDARNRGSSGGMFELLAELCLARGYYVCGAAFEGTALAHRLIKSKEELKPLLKSKYVQSSTVGIYRRILELLKAGEKVFFCGTPSVPSCRFLLQCAYLGGRPTRAPPVRAAAYLRPHPSPCPYAFDRAFGPWRFWDVALGYRRPHYRCDAKRRL